VLREGCMDSIPTGHHTHTHTFTHHTHTTHTHITHTHTHASHTHKGGGEHTTVASLVLELLDGSDEIANYKLQFHHLHLASTKVLSHWTNSNTMTYLLHGGVYHPIFCGGSYFSSWGQLPDLPLLP